MDTNSRQQDLSAAVPYKKKLIFKVFFRAPPLLYDPYLASCQDTVWHPTARLSTIKNLNQPNVRDSDFSRHSLLSATCFEGRFLGRAITPDADRFPHLNSQTVFHYAGHARRWVRVLFVPLSHSCLSRCYMSFGMSCRLLDVNTHHRFWTCQVRSTLSFNSLSVTIQEPFKFTILD